MLFQGLVLFMSSGDMLITTGDGIDSRTFNLEMTYICICECIKNTHINSFYVFGQQGNLLHF